MLCDFVLIMRSTLRKFVYFKVCVLMILDIGFVTCETVGKATRIVGGRIVKRAEFPYIVSIGEGIGEHFCGGIIIDTQNILTAAHCFFYENKQPMPLNEFVILAGDVFINNLTPRLQELLLFAVVIHPDYDFSSRFHDVAIARLENHITYTRTAQPAKLADIRVEANVTCTVAGWGVIRMSSEKPHPYMLKTTIQTQHFDSCAYEKRLGDLNETFMICAGDMKGGRDSCKGDSGGPLICNGVVAGVVSFGWDCGLPDIPAIYCDVAFYHSWINKIIKWNGKSPQPRVFYSNREDENNKGTMRLFTISLLKLSLLSAYQNIEFPNII